MRRALIALCVSTAGTAPAADPVPLFNGKDLTGWVNVNCAPDTFVAKGGEIVTNGKPTGYLRTVKQYENFVLDFDWMHVREQGMANSGLFVWGDPLPAVGTGYTRGIEVQVLINYETDWATSHGDLFSIWGAKCTPDRPHPKGAERCLPSEKRVKGAGQWNHYKVIANDGVLKLEVNGKEVSGVSKSRPRKGYLALESEGAECHFKNITIQELPSTNPKPEECADVWAGHVSLFDGLTLDGWKAEKADWTAGDGVIRSKGKTDLVSGKEYTNYELIFDWKLPAKSAGTFSVELGKNQLYSYSSNAPAESKWQRVTLRATADAIRVFRDGQEKSSAKPGVSPGPIAFKPAAGLELRNVFLNDLSAK
jgi:hypothetical protein